MSQAFIRRRDEQLRKLLLTTLHLARGFAPSGALSADRLQAECSVDQSEGMGFEDDQHFLRLCRDLVNSGHIAQKDKGTRRQNEMLKPRHVSYSITYAGTQLVEEKVPPVAGIADERAAVE